MSQEKGKKKNVIRKRKKKECHKKKEKKRMSWKACQDKAATD